MSNVDPVVNRPDEAVALGGKGPTLFILKDELHHGKVMHRLSHECDDLRLVEVRTSTREHLPEGLTVLVGSMDLKGVAPHVNLVVLHARVLAHTVFNDLAFLIGNDLRRNVA